MRTDATSNFLGVVENLWLHLLVWVRSFSAKQAAYVFCWFWHVALLSWIFVNRLDLLHSCWSRFHAMLFNFVVVYVFQGLHSIAVFENTLSLCHKWFPSLVVSTMRKTYKLKKFLLARWWFCLPCMVKAWFSADNHILLSQSECRKCNNYCPVWKDKKLVSFISTQCDVTGDEMVRRKEKDGTYIEVPTIPAVTLYKKYMGGIDRSDQMRQYYETSRRAKKWWCYLFWFCLDVSIVNAHILMQIADNHPHLTQLEFRLELVNALIGEFSSRQHNVRGGAVQTGHWPVKMTKGRCKRCLKKQKVTFCRMGCELCGFRICLACFKNHNTVDL